MTVRETYHPAEAIDDTVEALFHEQGRDRPAMYWLLTLFLVSAMAALPLVKVDLSVGARGIAHLSGDNPIDQPADSEAEGGSPTVTIEAFLRESDAKYLKLGQGAIVQYDAFPYTEWGSVSGTVVDIATEPVRLNQRALLKVVIQSQVRQLRLEDGRIGQILDGMTATVRVVVNRKSLLQLIYQKSDDLFGA